MLYPSAIAFSNYSSFYSVLFFPFLLYLIHLFRYVNLNKLSFQEQKFLQSSCHVPSYIRHLHADVIRHVIKMEEQAASRDTIVQRLHPGLFWVRPESDAGGPLTANLVSFGEVGRLPSCDCEDWQVQNLPCSHMCTVFRKVPDWGWDMFPSVYTGHPLLNLDRACLQETKRNVSNRTEKLPISRYPVINPYLVSNQREIKEEGLPVNLSIAENSNSGMKFTLDSSVFDNAFLDKIRRQLENDTTSTIAVAANEETEGLSTSSQLSGDINTQTADITSVQVEETSERLGGEVVEQRDSCLPVSESSLPVSKELMSYLQVVSSDLLDPSSVDANSQSPQFLNNKIQSLLQSILQTSSSSPISEPSRSMDICMSGLSSPTLPLKRPSDDTTGLPPKVMRQNNANDRVSTHKIIEASGTDVIEGSGRKLVPGIDSSEGSEKKVYYLVTTPTKSKSDDDLISNVDSVNKENT